MTDFEDYDNDSEQWICPICQDPLCPGCESSVQVRLLKFALTPVLIVIFALVLRWLFFGGEDIALIVSSDTSSPLTTTMSTTANSSNITTTAETTPISSPTVTGILTDETIRSVVQVVQIDALGPCSYGSGTVVGDGLTVLTNYHVIEADRECPQARIEVWTVDALDERPKSTHRATVLRIDEAADLAILTITPIYGGSTQLRPIPIKTSVSVGEEIFVIGFPGIGGSSITVSKGVVGGFTKEFGISWIKTDASISGGNSGGAALNSRGELVGVPTRASVSENGEIVDCRPTVDSNRDGSIDEYDACQPIGGFLNLLSPAGRADDLVKQINSGTSKVPSTDDSIGDETSEDPNSNEDTYTDPRFGTCKEAIKNGYGPYYDGVDEEYDWYRDADSDGIVCER